MLANFLPSSKYFRLVGHTLWQQFNSVVCNVRAAIAVGPELSCKLYFAYPILIENYVLFVLFTILPCLPKWIISSLQTGKSISCFATPVGLWPTMFGSLCGLDECLFVDCWLFDFVCWGKGSRLRKRQNHLMEETLAVIHPLTL